MSRSQRARLAMQASGLVVLGGRRGGNTDGGAATPMAHITTFAEMFEDLVDGFGGSKAELARAVGIKPSTVSHLLAGATPGIELCLKLAQVTGRSPTKILQSAGKRDLASLIERLYGEAR